MDYLLHIVILILIYATLAVALDLVIGQLGMVSLAHAAFFGTGAYTAGLLAVGSSIGFPWSVAAGAVVVVPVAVVVAWPSMRLQEDYFVIATFGCQVILYSLFANWTALTGGQVGLPGIPGIAVGGAAVSNAGVWVGLSGGLLAVACWVRARITRSPMGRVLRAIREDELFAQSLGKPVARHKMVTFTLSAILAALAGGLYAHYQGFIDPGTFGVGESILLVAMVVMGGAGSRWGPILGAAVLVGLPEALRFVGLPALLAAGLRQILYGVSLVALMLWRPAGLLGRAELRGNHGS